ncbi:MAG: rhomboid family intramembrane serine protease [Sedimentisphaerales bacterium]|nr:rhomboid family intramembrane serine protease [Sedimentisphaerales bacterium]
MIIPWKVDVPQDRVPFINWLILTGAITAFVFQMASFIEQKSKLRDKRRECEDRSVEEVAAEFGVDERRLREIEKSVEERLSQFKEAPSGGGLVSRSKDKLVKERILDEYFVWQKVRAFVLDGWGIKGLLGHMWLHGGFIHLLGNMLFLWIFGNSVCAKIGNIRYFFIYLFLGIVAGVSHLIFSGGEAIGASGAIYGIVGMFLVFFPENEITCYLVFWFFLTPYVREFSVSSIWIILLWVAFDVWGAMSGGGGVAYFAHLGGFAGGAVLAILMLKLKLVVMEDRYEKSLLQMFSGKKETAEFEPSPYYFGRSGLSERDLAAIKPDTSEAAAIETIPLESAVDPPRFGLAKSEVSPGADVGSKSGEASPSGGPEPAKCFARPTAEEFIRFTCKCGKRFKVPLQYAGKAGVCPKCKLRIRLPEK